MCKSVIESKSVKRRAQSAVQTSSTECRTEGPVAELSLLETGHHPWYSISGGVCENSQQ